MTPHPDHEQLSAHLDGEATADVGAHVEGCAACQARVTELRAVARAVGEPVDATPGTARDRAVAAALDAWTEATGGADDGASWGRGARLAEEPGVETAGRPGEDVVPLRRRHRVPAWTLAAAAVVAGVLVTGAVVATLDGDGGDGRTAMGPARTETSGAAGPAPVRDGGDLGEQSDARLLAEAVRDGLGDTDAAAPAGPSAPSTAPESTGPQSADAARSGPPPARETSRRAGEAPAATEGTASTERPCAEEARDVLPGLGALTYTATLRWQGTPAVVLVFLASPAAPPGPLAHQVVVMAPQEACRLLVAQRL